MIPSLLFEIYSKLSQRQVDQQLSVEYYTRHQSSSLYYSRSDTKHALGKNCTSTTGFSLLSVSHSLPPTPNAEATVLIQKEPTDTAMPSLKLAPPLRVDAQNLFQAHHVLVGHLLYTEAQAPQSGTPRPGPQHPGAGSPHANTAGPGTPTPGQTTPGARAPNNFPVPDRDAAMRNHRSLAIVTDNGGVAALTGVPKDHNDDKIPTTSDGPHTPPSLLVCRTAKCRDECGCDDSGS